ncbi:unnamed protein product [Caenorhabditis nigoni]
MPNSTRTPDECGPIRPFLILFSAVGIFGSPMLLSATPTYDGLVYAAFSVSFTFHCVALFGALKQSQLALMASENILFFVLIAMFFLYGLLPIALSSWKASGKSSYNDYPWYPMPETKGVKAVHAETDFRSGVKIGVIAQAFLLSVATFFYVEYRLIQELTQQIAQSINQEDIEILAEKC